LSLGSTGNFDSIAITLLISALARSIQLHVARESGENHESKNKLSIVTIKRDVCRSTATLDAWFSNARASWLVNALA